MELVPIRSTAEAVGFYLGGYLSKSLANKPPEAKGMRAVSYSRGLAVHASLELLAVQVFENWEKRILP